MYLPEVIPILHNSSCRRYLRSMVAQKTILSLYQVDVQTKHAWNDEHFNSTKRNNMKDEIERSTTGNTTHPQDLQTPSKTNARTYTTPKLKTLATTYRLEMMPILEIIQTLQTLRYHRSRKITSSKYNIFATSPLSRSASIRVRSRRGAQRKRKGEGRWSRPPRTFTHWSRPPKIFPCLFVQAMQTLSKTNQKDELELSTAILVL